MKSFKKHGKSMWELDHMTNSLNYRNKRRQISPGQSHMPDPQQEHRTKLQIKERHIDRQLTSSTENTKKTARKEMLHSML